MSARTVAIRRDEDVLTQEVGVLGVEVNNSDGTDHTDQAVGVAKAILQKLGG